MVKIFLKNEEDAKMAAEDLLWYLERDPEDREMVTLGGKGKFYADPDVEVESLFRVEGNCVRFDVELPGMPGAFEAFFRLSHSIDEDIVRIEAFSEDHDNFFVLPLPENLHAAAKRALDHYYYEVLPHRQGGLREAMHCASFERHVGEFIWVFEVHGAEDGKVLKQELADGILSDQRYIFDVDDDWQVRFSTED